MIKQLLFGLGLLIVFSAQAQDLDSKITQIDQYIEQARKQWKVPGLAVAIVKDGKVILSKGYGQLKIGEDEAANAHSIFGIASTTKAMTAAAMGMLVDEGKINWEDRVVDHLPAFQLSDPYISQNLRIKDLFTHNSGIGNADFLWVYNDLSEEEILHKMRLAPVSYPFRGGYTYQNIMYLAAGKVIEKVSGMSWATFLQDRIFTPLKMERTFPYLSVAENQENRFEPHHLIDGKVVPIENTNADAIGPAGSVWSCVNDMAKWMQFLLDGGVVGGKQLLSRETHAELFTPQIIIPREQFYPTSKLTNPRWTTYALGWFQHDYQGKFVSFHTGSLAGDIAIHGLMPDENLGVYFLGNLDHAEVRHAIMYKTFDIFGNTGTDRDWSTEIFELYNKRDQSYERQRTKVFYNRISNTQPSKPIDQYAGKYEHPFRGELIVKLENDQLILYPTTQQVITLKHFHFDTFLGTYKRAWVRPTYIEFHLDWNAKVDELKWGSTRYKKVN